MELEKLKRKTIESLELQVHRLHDQVDRKDQWIEKLMNAAILKKGE